MDPGFPQHAPQARWSARELTDLSSRPRFHGSWSRDRRVWRELAAAPIPARALAPRVTARRRVPDFPYRGLGDISALRNVLAVLLVGHTDPLLGDHLRGATCPKNHSDSLSRCSRAAGRLGSRYQRRLRPLGLAAERWSTRSPAAADHGGPSSRGAARRGRPGLRAEEQEANHRTVQPAASN